MKQKIQLLIFCLIGMLLLPATLAAQEKYEFVNDCQVKRTPAKNQASTSTCWCFAGTSLMESEYIRKSGKEIDLSEMFTVWNVYQDKANIYIRRRGAATFGPGSMPFHVPLYAAQHGIVPDEVFTGLKEGQDRHNHRQLHSALRETLEPAFKTGITKEWQNQFTEILNTQLGPKPDTFEYQGKTYTPKSFVTDFLQLDMNDYVVISSYTHHPFYEKFCLEINDNFDYYDDFYNLPLDELMAVADHALENGYSFVWNGDVSERGWQSRQGHAIIDDPESDDFGKELKITQQIRQDGFDQRQTTDDHAMHTVGLAHDQFGHKFYLTKNSHGADSGPFHGHVYISEAYTRAKMLFMVVNKNAVPKEIARKLNIQ